MSFRPAIVAFALLAISTGLSRAGDAASFGGAVLAPFELTEATLAELPSKEVEITFETGKGKESGRFKGATLWSMIERAGLADKEGKNPGLRHTLLVTGRDGYSVALSFGELDPKYEDKSVILAYAGGDPAASFEALRLIVPGDRHGGRSVKDVARIEVK